MRSSGISNYYGELLYKVFPSIKSVCVYYSGKHKQRQYLRVTLRQPDQDARNTFESIRNHLMGRGPQIFSFLYIHLTSYSNYKATYRLNASPFHPSRFIKTPLVRKKSRLSGEYGLKFIKTLLGQWETDFGHVFKGLSPSVKKYYKTLLPREN